MNPFLRKFPAELLCRALTDPSGTADLAWFAAFCAVSERAGSPEIPLVSLREEIRRLEEQSRARGLTFSSASLPAFLELRGGGRAVSLRDPERGPGDSGPLSVVRNPNFRPQLGCLRARCGVYWDTILDLRPSAALGTADLERLLGIGAGLFNRRLFFEFHELLEGAWRRAEGDKRRFLQGMIQMAVGFSRLQAGKVRGCLRLLREGGRKAASFSPEFLGVELRRFLAGIEFCRNAVGRLGAGGPQEFDWSLVPRLRAGSTLGEAKEHDLGTDAG